MSFETARPFSSAARLLLQTLGDGLALALERTELRRELDVERGRVAALEKQTRDGEEASATGAGD